MKQIVLIIALLGIVFAANNLQIRGCLDDATAEDVGVCTQQLKHCFDIKECGDEFSKLFNDCDIPLDDKEVDLPCFKNGKEQTKHERGLDLIECFDARCGLFGGTPSADLEAIGKQILENLEEYKAKEKASAEPRSESEEYMCLRLALTDPNKCYELADKCNEDCAKDLDKLRTCKDKEEKDCSYNLDTNLPNLVNEQAITLGQCVYKYCYENQPKTQQEEQQNQQEQTVNNEQKTTSNEPIIQEEL